MKSMYKISGMHCASCAVIIEKTLGKMPGVVSAQANYGNESLKLDFDDSKTAPEILSKAIEPLGYSILIEKKDGHAGMGDMNNAGHDHSKMLKLEELKAMKRTVFTLLPISAVTIAAMVWDALFTIKAIGEMPKFLANFFSYALPLMAIYALFFAGKQYLTGVWQFIRRGAANMDTLIGIGTGAAFFYSITVTIFAPFLQKYIDVGVVYYDVTIVVIAFITLGKYLEAGSKIKTGDAVRELLHLQAKTAVVIRNGIETETPVNGVQRGDLIRVKPGGKIPVDGIITDGYSNIDESMISGEPMPVAKKVGDQVVAGTINKQGAFVFGATKVGSETLLAQIIKMVEEAQGSRAPIQRLADKISGIFVPIVMAVATLALIVWLVAGSQYMPFSQSLSFGLMSFVGVLVIACPCALGLATPTAVIVGVGKGAREGILIKDAATLEKLYKADTIVVDKTGTITRGAPELTSLNNVSELPEEKALAILGSLEKLSEHPIARAIVESVGDSIREFYKVEDFKNVEGRGIEGVIDGKRYFVGSPAFMKDKGLKIGEKEIEKITNLAGTPVVLADAERIIAYASVSDKIKEAAPGAVSELHKMGIKVVMLSGDDKKTAEAIAKQVGIDEVIAEVMPAEKAEIVRKLQMPKNDFQKISNDQNQSKPKILDFFKIGIFNLLGAAGIPRPGNPSEPLGDRRPGRGKTLFGSWNLELGNSINKRSVVAMVGDGVNDAPALAFADVGIAMGNGTDVAIESAGIALLAGDISKLVKAVKLSRATMRTIKQNLFWAFLYNVIGIPLAAGLFYPIFGILLNPIFAGMAMALSSVSVVGNSLKLKFRKL